MSRNVPQCSVVAILIPVSRAGTGIGVLTRLAPIPVPARLTGIKIANTEQLRKQINSVTNPINSKNPDSLSKFFFSMQFME